jgi:DNA-binding transcriptional ArsR family regulator
MRVGEKDLEQLSQLFRVLADQIRLRILFALAEGEMNVSAICAALNLSQPTVSHHLSLLRMNNIVGHRRDGKQVIYSVDGRVGTDGTDALILSVQNLVVRIEPARPKGRRTRASRRGK